MEVQNNILNTCQSIFSKFIDDNYKSLNNFIIGERYVGAYKMNDHNESNNSKDVTRTINYCMLKYTTFNKSLEQIKKYYKNDIQNYFNIIKISEKSYNH